MITENPNKDAMRYIDNARAALKLAGKKDRNYLDEKYVHTACGTAYIGVLKALNMLFNIKNVPKKKGRKSIEYYQEHLSKIDKKLLTYLNNAYHSLHINGYYDGVTEIKMIEAGFENAILIINALKPYSKNGI
ncbi:MAG: hypothetical protein A2X61_07865 [Ignavibacteria bacterium GWB2_35_12]|nr:MAG: hypothetical protein A2X63_13000 [Ignavibacteria bacterium GWA2_35_8]OGU39501.1 MAG: hypothetical protein A2X61_07865 [Ignavibacteria bacterium GWB2_35_12]OGU90153.1 MAG: hypothetical protein A2220_16190 [Ignavibacteria bacterium RIFOXYA2_FULL_35_10]OGV21887.1 MAG: hypothetical protein A2475_09695 [Ignavibacteria bacterium RIFOXYC2_FULL_35_21]